MRLIGFRCTHSNVFSREVLICPVSGAEFCMSLFCFSVCNFIPIRILLDECIQTAPLRAVCGERSQNAGDSSEGSHPFPFRTRKLSLLEPMVLARGE
jgi:hypothetical protein